MPNKIEKIEYILQKGVEVGIRKFIFFRSEFSQKPVISDAKKNRLSTIAREAVEQCGGVSMPEIEFVNQITNYESRITNLALDTTGKSIKVSEIPKNHDISIWIGPEG
jgi:RsmE family RNA methyltransferase